MMDVLSELFQVMELDSTLYFRECFYGDWGMDIPEGPFCQFHLLVNGRATLELPRSRERLPATPSRRGGRKPFCFAATLR